MKFQAVVRPAAAVLGAALFTGSLWAQTADTPKMPLQGPAVATDAGPPPAEDRSSHGAIVLDNSRVRAQRGIARGSRDPATVMGNVAKPAERALRESGTTIRKDEIKP